jgi:YjbE family integral membrane protein
MALDAQFWLALVQIIGINIILSGDNAVVIALACRGLPPKQQRWGVILGAGAAVVLRVIFTIFIVYLLSVPYLKLVGGLLLFWIGYKLMLPQGDHDNVDEASNLWAAVRIVAIADAVMSLDNVIAVAAAAKGSVFLLVLGIVISVPLVVYGAALLITLINRFPVIVPGGAALIGFVGAEVAITDPAIEPWIAVNAHWLHDAGPLLGALAVVLAGRVAAPPVPAPAAIEIAEEAAGAAALVGARLAIQVIGRVIVGRAPLIVSFGASLFGYTVGEQAVGGQEVNRALTMAYALRPLFAAAIAVALGELAAWLVRRLRGKAENAPNVAGPSEG